MTVKNKNKIRKYINWFLNKPKTIVYLVFITLFCILIIDILKHYQIEKERKCNEINNTLEIIRFFA